MDHGIGMMSWQISKVMDSQNDEMNHNKSNTIYFICICSFFLLILTFIPDYYFEPLTHLTAVMISGVINAIGLKSRVVGPYVSSLEFQINIIPSCTPVVSILIYSAFIITRQYSLRRGVECLISGACILFAVNLLRLIATFIISMYKPDLFHITHVYLGQLLTSGVLIALCIGQLQFEKRTEEKDSPLLFLLRTALLLFILIIPWWYLFPFYIHFIDICVIHIFKLFGFQAHLELQTNEVPLSVFNVIIFFSLVLASKSIKTRAKTLIFGFSILSFTQLLMNICLLGNYIQPKMIWAVGFKSIGLIHAVMPFIMWVIANNGMSFVPGRRYVGPIFGQNKSG